MTELEIYKKAKEVIINKEYILESNIPFLCTIIQGVLGINHNELYQFCPAFLENRPMGHSLVWFWGKNDKEDVKLRLDYLDMLIEKLENNG